MASAKEKIFVFFFKVGYKTIYSVRFSLSKGKIIHVCLWLGCELIPVEHTHSSQSLRSQVDLDSPLGSTTCHLCDRRWGRDPPLVLNRHHICELSTVPPGNELASHRRLPAFSRCGLCRPPGRLTPHGSRFTSPRLLPCLGRCSFHTSGVSFALTSRHLRYSFSVLFTLADTHPAASVEAGVPFGDTAA